MKKTFTTSAPETVKWDGGYGGGTIRPVDIADELFCEVIEGPWLAVYMLRRFGWPNAGSDDYKQLMEWNLTTPMNGLYLSVCPYLGESNLHFGIRFSRAIERELERDPQREAYWHNKQQSALRWWKNVGSKQYSFGNAKRDDPDEKLVHEYGEGETGAIWGFYERKPVHKNKYNITPNMMRSDPFLYVSIEEFRVKLGEKPDMSRCPPRKKTRFQSRVEAAIRQTMADLLRPTNVRDISFNAFGNMDKTYAKKPKPEIQPSAPWFAGAGNTPSYYYSQAGIAERKKAMKFKKKP